MLKYINIVCPKCNKINYVRQDHINNYKCKNCFNLEFEELTKEFEVLKGCKKATIKLELKCKCCNQIWKVLLSNLRKNNKCPKCNTLTKQYFEENKLDDFIYSEFKHAQEKMLIVCKNCNSEFYQTPYNNLIRKNGCPFCNESKGEKEIRTYLEKNNINFERYKTYEKLRDKYPLNHDFYLPNCNLLIEYNGNQHYKFNKHFHKTNHDFHKQLHHDWLKRKYAKSNNINLLVIKYTEFDSIEEILKENI